MKKNNKRAFLIVLDSMGIGEMPDAHIWNDEGSDTLGAIREHPEFNCPNLAKLGLFNIEGVKGEKSPMPSASYARMHEASLGKDTTIGHWEIAGICSEKPFPTYPDGFPAEVIEKFEKLTGRGTLCNKPYSGTDVIRDYGDEHVKTGKLIVYTSADSVFQIAAHEDVVPIETLYEYCKIAREMLKGEHGVGRVIARPFEGVHPFKRTPRRHDFSLVPPSDTVPSLLKDNGFDTISVGKIYDIFAGVGFTESYPTVSNTDGMDKLDAVMERDFNGLCFVNLVDFDMVYGHRNDISGYARAMTEFDQRLGKVLESMKEDDILIITADHGCDPSTPSTDHSREYTPLLVYGKKIKSGVNLGTRNTFADIGATVLDWFSVSSDKISGSSFLEEVSDMTDGKLLDMAIEARKNSYSPYSNFRVGAALLSKSGKVYTGCNVENAAYSPTNCAERTAVFKAVSEGERDFEAIAIVGGNGEEPSELCAPCGVCRQVLAEFCTGDFKIIMGTPENIKVCTLSELLPYSFGKSNLE